MIKKYKLALRLMRYGYGGRQCILLFCLFFGLGAVCWFMGNGMAGSACMIGGGMYASQILQGMNVSFMVQSSPKKKIMQTALPALLHLSAALIIYGIILLLEQYMTASGRHPVTEAAYTIIMAGGITMMMLFYSGIVYKLFALGVVLVLWVCVGMNVCMTAFIMGRSVEIPLWAAALLGVGEILVGSLLLYLASLAVYKLPLSKTTQLRMLQKYM